MTTVIAAKRVLLGKTCNNCFIGQMNMCTSFQQKDSEEYGTCLSFNSGIVHLPLSRTNNKTNSGRIYPQKLWIKGKHGI